MSIVKPENFLRVDISKISINPSITYMLKHRTKKGGVNCVLVKDYKIFIEK